MRRRHFAPVFVTLGVVAMVVTVWFSASGRTGRLLAEPRPLAVPTAASPSPAATPEPSPSSADAAGAQAIAIDGLLSNSSTARSGLTAAITRVRGCDREGMRTINGIARARQRQLKLARSLETGLLTEGTRLKRSLIEALDNSYKADAAFYSWARRYLRGGCGGRVETDRDYGRGLNFSSAAETAKADFIELWNPVAMGFGLKARQSGGI
ncbi:hypothetical protein [Sphaerisporangium corydalis]|uniref:hypothetical protein n=1 Tax=Sphaerisporangium corydalis TaxID=1441875 RepID=UPI0036D3A9F4